MSNIIKNMLNFIYTVIYFNLIGEIKTETIETNDKFSMSYNTRNNLVLLKSTRFKHITTYKRWFNMAITSYTFLIEVIHIDDKKENLVKSIPMPLLCNTKFIGSTLPHRLAINQCIEDNLI